MNKSEFSTWFDKNIASFTTLGLLLISLIEGILTKNKLEFLSVSGRPKDKLSALSKLDRKEYSSANEEMTDLCGVRIITFLDTQVRQIETVLRDAFDIDEKNTSDRSKILNEDKVGYRSIHIVATLGSDRAILPEYRGLHELKFEIQIRTVLQHAWAELAHDRSFKFGITLPTSIQRRLNLHAGLLELVDNAFIEIAREIDDYKDLVETQPFGQLLREQIDEISLLAYVKYIGDHHSLKLRIREIGSEVIKELKDFGFKTVGEIDQSVTEEFIKGTKKYEEGTIPVSSIGFLRSIMMYTDLERYFDQCWYESWSILRKSSMEFLMTKYTRKNIERIVSKYNIVIS